MPETRYFKFDPRSFRPEELAEPAAVLRGGGLVAFPTETVYGLGASAQDPTAVDRLRQVKGREAEKPFTLHLADISEISRHVGEVPRSARLLMDRYWPGPLTIIFPDGDTAGGGGPGLGVRIPASELARELIRRTGAPLWAPSANPQGRDPATDAEGVRAYFDGVIDAVVDGGPSAIKQSSTVVAVSSSGYRVLREGIISHEMIHQLLVGKNILFVCSGNSCRSPMAAALFQKHLAEKLGTDPEDLGQLGYSIHSAGTFAVGGGWASQNAIKIMEEAGLDISNHISRPVTAAMVRDADQIYTMSESHLRQIVEWNPGIENKIRPLAPHGISDPIGGSVETYRMCAAEIEAAIVEILAGF